MKSRWKQSRPGSCCCTRILRRVTRDGSPVRFYFDSIVDANVTLDIYGTLVPRPGSDAIAISVETRSRWAPGSPNFSGPQRSVTSDILVKPAARRSNPAADVVTTLARLPSVRSRSGFEHDSFAEARERMPDRANQRRPE